IGLCNSAMGFQRMVARLLEVRPKEVTLEHVGLNHLTWERAAHVDGKDRLPELIDRSGDEIGREIGIPGELIRLLGAIPSYYLRYYYLTDEIVREQQSGAHPSRAEEVMRIERTLLELYRDPSLDRKPTLLSNRRRAFYTDAAASFTAPL